jgi:hypothetical protein
MKISAFLLTLLLSTQAFAWGDLGHRAVGEVATKHLTPTAKFAVMLINGGESLAQQATWADEVRSDDKYKWLTLYHFISIDTPTFDHEHHDDEKVDAVSGIKKNIAILKSADKSAADKRQALSILVHLVGDVHQPLHAGYTDDRGGNNCKVQYFGKPANLHSVLDSSVFEHSGLSFTETARFVMEEQRELLGDDNLQKLAATDVNTWIQESINIRDQFYPNKENTSWKLKTGDTEEYLTKRGYCKLDRDEKNSDLMPNLDYLYNYKLEKTLRRRVLLAGVRLAHVLNEIFAAELKK